MIDVEVGVALGPGGGATRSLNATSVSPVSGYMAAISPAEGGKWYVTAPGRSVVEILGTWPRCQVKFTASVKEEVVRRRWDATARMRSASS